MEEITRYIKPERDPFPCRLYEIEVSEQEYSSVKRILKYYVKHKNKMSYTKIGLVMTLMGIPFKKKYAYFCSQFVAEVLQGAKVAMLKKPTNFYLPCDFYRHGSSRIGQRILSVGGCICQRIYQ